MAWRDVERTGHIGTARQSLSFADTTPWVFPFDRTRHERARARLGPDRAAEFTRPATTADVIELYARELDDACVDIGRDPWSDATVPSVVLDVLVRLADVEERHLVLVGREPGHDTLTLAELAVAHRRQLVRHVPTQRPLLALALVLLTHQLHAAGRIGDAVTAGREAVEILSHAAADTGDDSRAALVLALDVSLMSSLASGRRDDAVGDLVRATHTLDDLARDERMFAADLVDHLEVLAMTAGKAATARDGADGLLERSLREPGPHPAAQGVQTTRVWADELYDEAVRLATCDGDGPASAAAAGAAVSEYRRLLAVQPAEHWYAVLRRLARALWRHAIVLNELLGRPRDAMGPGREALLLTRRALRVVEHAEEFERLVAELGIRLHDLGHIARCAGLIGEHDQLAEEARRLHVDSVGGQAMRALGAALHDRAAEACETTVALAEAGRDIQPTVAAGLTTSRAAVVARRIVLGDDPMSRWELANSQLAHGHLLCLDGEGQRGAQAIADAYDTVRALPGPAGQTMREAAEAALMAACSAYPDVIPPDGWQS
jgi:hypothetical protein